MDTSILFPIWIPRWLYWSIPRVCAVAGMLGLISGYRTVPLVLFCYGIAVLMIRSWHKWGNNE